MIAQGVIIRSQDRDGEMENVLRLNIQKTKHHFMANKEKMETLDRLYFLGLQNLWMVTKAMKLKDTCSLKEKL